MKIRRGSIRNAGELDKLSDEDKEKLLDRVKEKLLSDMDVSDQDDSDGSVDDSDDSVNDEVEDDNEEPDSVEEEDNIESSDEELPQEKEQIKDNKKKKNIKKKEKKEKKEINNKNYKPMKVIKLRRGSNDLGTGLKDKDVMSDTGGQGKHKIVPDFKPSRSDSEKEVTDKKLTKENRDDYSDTVGDKDVAKDKDLKL